VTPYYAVKANPQDAILKEFTKDEKMGFDVASKGEMERVLAAGGNPERMIFANTVKTPESLKYAVSKGVKMMTFDSLPELQKIAKYAPKAKVLVRIKVSNVGSVVELSIKFGCDPSDAIPLLIEAVKLGLQPVGVSFHVGSQCTNVENYLDAFEVASIILNDAKLKQIHLNIIDIGGGFPIQHFDADEDYFTKMAPMIRKEIDRLFDNHIQVISEPGRALCGPAGTLIMSVIGKSIRDNKNWYYCDDGVYGSLSGMIFDHCKYQFKYFKKGALHLSAIAGPTCDSLDVMSMSESLPELQIGDLIYIENIGAYSTASNTHFNFISQAKIVIID
jgi:ornithine decarboxylase